MGVRPREMDRILFSPLNSAMVWWEVAMVVFVLYSAFMVPYRIAFANGANPCGSSWPWDSTPFPSACPDLVYWIVNGIAEVSFVVDIVFKFNTAFIEDVTGAQCDTLVFDRRRIAERYCRGWFWCDFLSVVPFDLIFAALGENMSESATSAPQLIRILRVARLFKLVRLVKLQRFVTAVEDDGLLSPFAMEIGFLFAGIMFLAHLLACVFFFMSAFIDIELRDNNASDLWRAARGGGTVEGGRFLPMFNRSEMPAAVSTTWYEMQGLAARPQTIQYIVSLYWAFTTMTTLGYGDQVPEHWTERLFCIVCMFIGAVVFGYIIGHITQVSARPFPLLCFSAYALLSQL
jgi:hypothetical protein